MSFNSSHVVVHGHAINNVDGNQYNHTQTITAEVVYINGQREMERTEYDEYEQVKRGHVFTLKRLHTEDRSDRWEWEEKDGELVRRPNRSQTTVCTVQVHPYQQTKTAIIYEGKDAHVYWKDDFERFSRAGLGKPGIWQLYGLNYSSVPFLIFHDEMVPLSHFYKRSFWKDMFVRRLAFQMDWPGDRIWVNSRGSFCEGTAGPRVEAHATPCLDTIIVPSTSDMLQDETFIQFLRQCSSTELDSYILLQGYDLSTRVYLDTLFPKLTGRHPFPDHNPRDWTVEYHYLKDLFCNLPPYLPLDIIGGLRFDTIYSSSLGAVARWPQDARTLWRILRVTGLVDETEVGDGLIRFKLDDPARVWVLLHDRRDMRESWLAQSLRVIDVHRMSGLEEELFTVVPPDLAFLGAPLESQKPSIAVEERPPIYLFIDQPPMSISEVISWLKGHTRTYFWSLDENGQHEMSEEHCRRWSLPELNRSTWYEGASLRSWPANIYNALRRWQDVRNFDTTTADWAQSLGHPEMEIIGLKKDEEQLKELYENTPWVFHLNEQGGLPEQNGRLSVQETLNEGSEAKPSLWWLWSCEAGTGSGISAFMC